MGRITKLHLCAFWRQERLLQARKYAGKWDMTGGRGKAGEIPIKAACRELMEDITICRISSQPAGLFLPGSDPHP